jgi:hypothetical protein
MRIVFAAALLGLLAFPAEGQTIWSRPYEPNQIAVEAIVPEAPDGASVLSGATFVTGTLSLNNNVELAAEMPVARYGSTVESVSSTTALGNPYLGVGLSSTTLPVLVEVGARLPVAPSNAAARLGQAAGVGRTSAFGPEELVLSTLLNGRLSVGRYSTLRLRAGAEYATRSRPDGGTARSWGLLYEAQIWREGERLITGLSATGRARLSGSGTTRHHAVLSVMLNGRRVQPGLLAGTSLNDLVREGTFTPFAGLTLSFTYMRR